MKLTDFVADFLAKEGITHVFGLTGGAVVHFFDSLQKNPSIQPIFNHHEQAAAFAAPAYAKVKEGLGLAIVTTGPGGTNAISGLCAAWLDSVPCIYISGQTRFEHTSRNKPFRQLGTQELDIISIVEPITKYAVMVEKPERIKFYLQKAVHIAKTGRPGPVWIDVPLTYQWAEIEPDELEEFDPKSEKEEKIKYPFDLQKLLKLIENSKRPLILAGSGIRLANATKEFIELIEKTKIPFVSTWLACDIIPTDNESYVGRPGIAGQRGANFAVQNCDLLISLGSHLCIPITDTNYKNFARGAKKIVVDIDPVELDNPTVKVDLPIQANVKEVMEELLSEIEEANVSEWREKCSKYKKYNSIPSEWGNQKEFVNPYYFVDKLSDHLDKNDTIVVDGGGNVVYTAFQAMRVKGQRMILSTGLSAMGSGLPESIGACFANDRKRTICLVGDGSLQLNIQEMQTIAHHNLPVKIFIFNNQGYLSIRQTQDGFLDKNHVGSEAEGGMSLPNYQNVAKAYGIKSIRLENSKNIEKSISIVLNESGPMVCEIMIAKDQEINPRKGFIENPDGTFSPRPLEDMLPFLDRKEFMENMIVDPLPESRG